MEGKSPKKSRRTLKDIDDFIEPRDILGILENSRAWPYKENREFYIPRDRALISLLYLTAGRISEVLGLRKKDFILIEDDRFILIKGFKIKKRKKKTIQREGIPRVDIPLPREGPLKEFTEIVEKFLPMAPERGEIFRFGRKRAHQIVKYMAGLWPHYFRAQRFSRDVNKNKSALIVSKLFGVKNPGTLAHYYKTEWELHKEAFLK